jgi:hypothetical protein
MRINMIATSPASQSFARLAQMNFARRLMTFEYEISWPNILIFKGDL